MAIRPRIPASIRRQVADRSGHRYSYCQSPEWAGIAMVIDHVIPLAAGGSQSIDNLCLCCYRCNEYKGARLTAADPASGEMIALFNFMITARRIWNLAGFHPPLD